jgi:hypothetical protein
MVLPQVIQGNGEEIAAYLIGLKSRKNLFLIIPAEEDAGESDAKKRGKILEFGMFPQLLGLTDDDFVSAEWRGEVDDLE